uniref:Ig-like domain-containing protein n=1 Tax=Seriola dumerili TaxID=41447 RepID=A0A3B4VMX8_SERDU
MSLTLLLATLGLLVQGSSGENIVTQYPGAVSAVLGQTAYIYCRVRTFYSCKINWYVQKPGDTLKLLIKHTYTRHSGVSNRFSGSEFSGEHALIIGRVQAEDAGVYHCKCEHTYYSDRVFTQLEFGSDARPTLTVLPPSSEELKQGKVTVLCLANKGFPSDWSLAWKVDGSRSSSCSWEESRSPGVLEEDGLYSWSSTLRLPADQWSKLGSVTCEATQGSKTPVSETLRRDQCSQS